MASKFENTAEIVRDHNIEGYDVRMFIHSEGIKFIRKGDRSREKATVFVSWSTIAELGAERDPNNTEGKSFYSLLGLDT